MHTVYELFRVTQDPSVNQEAVELQDCLLVELTRTLCSCYLLIFAPLFISDTFRELLDLQEIRVPKEQLVHR